MNQEASIQQQFEEAQAFVSQARQQLKEGQLVDISALEGMIQQLCSAITELPKEQASEYAASLQVLIGEISTFENDMVQQRDAVKAELEGLGKVQHAHKAYKHSEALQPPGTPAPKEEESSS